MRKGHTQEKLRTSDWRLSLGPGTSSAGLIWECTDAGLGQDWN